MAAGERTLKVKVDGESRGLESMARRSAAAVGDFDKRVAGAGRSAAKSEKDVDRLNKRVGGMGSAAGLAAIGIGAAAAAWVAATGAALVNVERLRAQTDTVVKSMGAVWTNTGDIVAYAEQLERLTGIEMEQVQAGQNLLLTYGNIQNRLGAGNNVFDRATTLMVDLSVATGKAMPEAANLLGKALNDPLKGLAALNRVGVQFTEQQRAQIKAMVEAGDVMGAQKIILAELQKQFGGSAEAFGETTAGQVLKLQNEFGNLSEELLVDVLPALNDLVALASDVVDWLQQNEDLVKSLAVGLGGLAATWLLVHGAIKIVNIATAAWNAVSKLAQGSTIGLGASFAALSTSAKIASLSMGAIGIVATIIGTAMSIFSGQSAEADARQQALTQSARDLAGAIAEQNGAIDENIRKKAAQIAEDNQLLVRAEVAGVASKDVIAALLDENGARDEVIGRLKDQYAEMVRNGDANTKEGIALLLLIRGLNRFTGEMDSATEAERRKKDAAESGTEATDAGTEAINAQITALEELITKQAEAAGIVLEQSEAEIGWQEALDRARASAAENGETLDILTEKGRNNRGSLNDLAKSTFDLIAAQAANGASNTQLVGTMANARAAFIATARQMGLNETEAKQLADQLGLIPGDYNANVNVNSGNALARLQGIVNKLKDIQSTINILNAIPFVPGGAIALGLSGGRRATGGPVLEGRSYVVGERGPEIFTAPNSGTIIPNHMLASGGDVAVYVTIDGQQLQSRIDRTVRENNRSIRRGAGAGTGRSR